MAASDENALELDNLLYKEDSFNTLVNEKLKKINKKK